MSGDPQAVTDAEAAFLERCREDLERLFAPNDRVVAVELRRIAGGRARLRARVTVSGRPGTFTASGDNVLEAYGRLRAAAPEQRLALAFRAVIAEGGGR